MELQCYVQLFVFTCLTSKHFCFIERALPQRVLLSFSTGWESKRPRVQKHIPSHAAEAKRFFFFFSQYSTIFPHHTSTETHSHTPARTQFVVVVAIYPASSDCVFSIVWPCICILSSSVSLMPVTVAGCGSSAAPTGGGLMGSLLLKLHILL